MDFEKLLKHMQRQYTEEKTKKDLLVKEKSTIVATLGQGEEEQKLLELEDEVIKKAARKARTEAGKSLEIIGTHALQYIFEENKSLEVVFNDRDECHIYITKEVEIADGKIQKAFIDPTNAEGGGLADVVSFSLTFAMDSLLEPKNDFPLLFDEPSKFVSKGAALGNPKRVANFFKDISHDWDRQILIVSHNDELISAADKAFRVTLDVEKNQSHTEEVLVSNPLTEMVELINNAASDDD